MGDVRSFQKETGRKRRSKKSVHDFPEKVKKVEYEQAKGLCRICHSEPITQYHHINEKGMGGGRGLGIQINCLGVGDRCHNHDNTEFLRAADEILRQRIERIFEHSKLYTLSEVAIYLRTERTLVESQYVKGFLKAKDGWPTGEEIKRWLGVA